MNREREPDTAPDTGLRLSAAELAMRLAATCPEHHLDLAGAVALPCPLPHADRWRAYVAEGRHGGLEYLARDPEARLDPTLRFDWATTLLVFAQRYTDGWPVADPDPSAGGPAGSADDPPWTARVARYARGLDYHDLLKRDITAAVATLGAAGAPPRARISVDTGPYLEREYAWLAGLGFLGRTTCLIHEKLGSGCFRGVALTRLLGRHPGPKDADTIVLGFKNGMQIPLSLSSGALESIDPFIAIESRRGRSEYSPSFPDITKKQSEIPDPRPIHFGGNKLVVAKTTHPRVKDAGEFSP